MTKGEVLFIDIDREIVIVADGTLPITSYLDEDGDPCDKQEAVSFVFGDGAHGFALIYFADLKPRVLH